MSTPPVPPVARSQVEIEYRELREHLERLVRYSATAIAIIVAVAGFFLYNSVSDAKKDATAAITATRESAGSEISSIGKAAEGTARSEAQKAIDTAFEKQNVQRMIEGAAQKKVDAAVEAAVEKNLGARIEAFRSLINEIGEISNHGAQLRLGYRSGLDYLLKKRESTDSTVRAYASSTLKLIAADYELAAQPVAPNSNITPKQLMEAIRTARDPFAAQQIALAFYEMKNRVKWNVEMFDIPAAEQWCAARKPTCDENLPAVH